MKCGKFFDFFLRPLPFGKQTPPTYGILFKFLFGFELKLLVDLILFMMQLRFYHKCLKECFFFFFSVEISWQKLREKFSDFIYDRPEINTTGA